MRCMDEKARGYDRSQARASFRAVWILHGSRRTAAFSHELWNQGSFEVSQIPLLPFHSSLNVSLLQCRCPSYSGGMFGVSAIPTNHASQSRTCRAPKANQAPQHPCQPTVSPGTNLTRIHLVPTPNFSTLCIPIRPLAVLTSEPC